LSRNLICSLESDDRVGIVIPTLGTREEFLIESIKSVREAGNSYIQLVHPSPETVSPLVSQAVDSILLDMGDGLAAAINRGIRMLPKEIEFVSWLGDDDRLAKGSLNLAASVLRNSDASCVFGRCCYINSDGEVIYVSPSGQWASWLQLVGPQLVPQPGSLFRRQAFSAVGGLKQRFRWAFDLDLFLSLRKVGSGLIFVAATLADFRWHATSLSVSGRKGSVKEASEIRRTHLPRPIQPISYLWEPVLRFVILHSAKAVGLKERRISRRAGVYSG